VHPDSALIGLGQSWIDAGNKYGINPVYLMAHAMHETGWGLKNDYLVYTKHNLYGYGASDSNPNENAMNFSSWQESIDVVAGKIKENYLTEGGKYFHKEYGATLQGMNINYASDKNWATSISNVMNMFANWLGKCPNDPKSQESSFFIEPVSKEKIEKISCGYDYTTCYKAKGHEIGYHSGIDILPKSGNPEIRAVGEGKIVKKQLNDGSDHNMGNTIIIEHNLKNGNKIYSLYAHLDSFAPGISEEIEVPMGKIIGYMGGTGDGKKNWSIHLHFEIKDDNTLENPKGGKPCLYNNVVGPCWGYMPNSADNYGYHNPYLFIKEASRTSWEFNTPGDLEGWEPHNVEGNKYSVENGALFIDPSESDPWIENNGLFIDATALNSVRINMSSNAPDNFGAIYFTTTESPSYSDEKKVTFKVITGQEWRDYTVLMAGNAFWKGTITGIRVDPANNGKSNTDKDTVGFDYIRVESSNIISAQALYPYPNTITAGDELTFVYNIANPFANDVPIKVRLGAQIRTSDPKGEWIDDMPNDKIDVLKTGTNDYSRLFRTTWGLKPGYYDAHWVVMDEGTKQWIDHKELSQILIVNSNTLTSKETEINEFIKIATSSIEETIHKILNLLKGLL